MSGSADISWFSQIDTRIWQAVLAGIFVAGGWLCNGWQNRRDAARQRAEKLRDMHRAIYAEISVYISNIWDEVALQSFADDMMERIKSEPDFVPLIPRERGDVVFSHLIDQIHILPRQTIDPIVTYYSQLNTISEFIEDMRGASFKEMAPERRAAMYRDYIAMKRQALQFGRIATQVINVYGKSGPEAAGEMAKRLSSRATDPSDLSQGSE